MLFSPPSFNFVGFVRGVARGLRKKRSAVRVEHVRYVKKPAKDPLETALELARQMNRPDLIGKVEAVRGGR